MGTTVDEHIPLSPSPSSHTDHIRVNIIVPQHGSSLYYGPDNATIREIVNSSFPNLRNVRYRALVNSSLVTIDTFLDTLPLAPGSDQVELRIVLPPPSEEEYEARQRRQRTNQQQQRQHHSHSSSSGSDTTSQGRDWFPFSSRAQSHPQQAAFHGVPGDESSFQSLKLLWGALLLALWIGLWLNQKYFSQLSIILLLVLSFFFVVYISSVDEVVSLFTYIITSIAMIFGCRSQTASYFEHRRDWDHPTRS